MEWGRSTLACAVAKTAMCQFMLWSHHFLDIDYVLDEMEQLFEEIYQLQRQWYQMWLLLFKNIENFALVPDKDLNSILEKLVSFFRTHARTCSFFPTVEGGTRIASLLFDPPAF